MTMPRCKDAFVDMGVVDVAGEAGKVPDEQSLWAQVCSDAERATISLKASRMAVDEPDL